MTMQWTADAYEGFTLSEAKKADCKRIAMILVHEALRHYQLFDQSVPRALDSKRWKPIKTSKNVTMYRERNPSRRVVKDSYTGSGGWQMPRVLVGNGTISNSIDDLLYGLVNGDEAAILQNVAYSGQPVTDAQILETIEKPTLEHPYRCTTLQWHAGSPSPTLRGVVKDRDAVYIRATGILQVSKDERIGYNLLHSVDLPFTPPLQGRSIIRSRGSSCVLFKPTSDESVEVFAKSYYEVFGNNLLDSIGVVTLASALMVNWTSAQCAKVKKLMWLLQRKSVNRKEFMAFIGKNERVSKSKCRFCERRFGRLCKAYPCKLCKATICGKCSFSIGLIEVAPHLKLMTNKVLLCPSCDELVSQISSYKVARQEIRAGRYEKDSNGTTVVKPSRIRRLKEASSDLLGKESCPGEVYGFDSHQLIPSTEDSFSAFAQFTSSNDDVQIIDSRRRSSDEGVFAQGGLNDKDELDTLVENIWRSSISELELKDQERDRQLAWLKMTELRLRQDG